VKKPLGSVSAAVVAAIALVALAAAPADASVDQIVVAHRGATTSTIAEGTLRSYQYAVKNHADILDGDVRWTKDSSDADTVGTMVISHDSTLDRVTNCSGYVSEWLWTSIKDKCRTDVGGDRIIRLADLLTYSNSAGKPVALQIKLTSLTDAQAKQFWNAVKTSRVQLEASSGQLPSMAKIKKLDAADPAHKITYAFVTSGTNGWPSVATIKATGTMVHAHLSIPVGVMRTYQQANLRVFLWTGKNEVDYAKMVALQPYGVVVNDVGRFERWRDSDIVL